MSTVEKPTTANNVANNDASGNGGASGNTAEKPKRVKKESPYKGAVRAYRFECIVPNERQEAWLELAEQSQAIINTIWQTWLVWHHQNGTRQVLLETIEKRKQLRKHLEATIPEGTEKRAKKINEEIFQQAKLPFAVESECNKAIYAELTARFPAVHVSTIATIQKIVTERISKTKPDKGSLPGWIRIVLGLQRLPGTGREQPIYFKKDQSPGGEPLSTDGKIWKLSIRIERQPIPGKKVCPSIVDEVRLLTGRGKKAGKSHDVLRKLKDGTWKFCNSSIVFDQHRRKWYALLAYQLPENEPAEYNGRVAVVRAGRNGCWRVAIFDRLPALSQEEKKELEEKPEKKARATKRLLKALAGAKFYSVGGDGREVASLRARLASQRIERHRKYRYAPPSSKGHGRKKAISWMRKLEKIWNNFCHNRNHTCSAIAMRIVRNCDEVYYIDPIETSEGSRCLARSAGDGRGGWQFFQFKAQLASKLAIKSKRLIECGQRARKRIDRKSGVDGNDQPLKSER